jgi:cbb3-type cytochrome oxidase subunit 3
MIPDAVSHAASIWPRIGLILFFLLFVAIVIWTYRGRKDRFAYVSQLPLDDQESLSNRQAESTDSARNQP